MAIRYRDAIAYGDGTLYVKVNLNSSDTKPTTGIATGSIATETDTGKSYVFDEDSGNWTELKSSGGGITPTGTISITANGTGIDVAQYALADVNVSGGGGGLELLTTKPLGNIETSNTSAVDTGLTIELPDTTFKKYDTIITICKVDTQVVGRHVATVSPLGLLANSSDIVIPNYHSSQTQSKTNYILKYEGMYLYGNSTGYGVFATNAYEDNYSKLVLKIYTRYSSSQTGTINGNYTAYVYGINLYDLI